MSAYRFCRSDDVALLVRAHNECYRPHFPEQPEMTVERFKALIRELDLWTSSCMVARAGEELVGVLLAAKRESANRVLSVGVKPGHQGRGHGRHMMASLAQKLAILTPRRMEVELPEKMTVVTPFLDSCGYEQEATFFDLAVPAADRQLPPGAALVMPISFDEVAESGALPEPGEPRSWIRSARTLHNLRKELQGLAVATDTIEAFALYRDLEDPAREILALGPTRSSDSARALVLESCLAGARGRVVLPGLHEEEIAFPWLETAGFERHSRTTRFVLEAEPA